MNNVPVRTINFTAGQTFIDQALWCQGERVYKPVVDIVYGLPTQIKSPAHGIPEELVIAIWFENMNSKAFAPETTYFARALDANTIVLLDHNSHGIKPASLGTLFYIPPIDTAGLTIVTQFRKSLGSTVLLEVRSDGVSPGFVFLPNGIISMELTPDQTRSLLGFAKNPVSGIAQVEVTNADSQVSRPWDYAWTVSYEGTKE